MSDQELGHGHHALTQNAVQSLFSDFPPGSKLMGLSENEFFNKHDHSQNFADGFPFGDHFAGHASRYPGNTYLPSEVAPHAQAAHAVAAPRHDAKWNLEVIRHFVVDNLAAAKAAHAMGDQQGEWRHLGAAVHCLQDSYSSAHMLRDPSNPTDPTATIQGINNFSIPHTPTSTHNSTFDSVPVTEGRLVAFSYLRKYAEAAGPDIKRCIRWMWLCQVRETSAKAKRV